MEDEIIIIITDPPRPGADSEKATSSPCYAERFNASTLAGLRAARRRIQAMIDAQYPDMVDEE